VCLLFAGSQLSFAQNKANLQTTTTSSVVQMTPKEKTNKIANLLERTDKLDADQKQKVFDIFASVDKKMKGIDAVADDSQKIEKRAKMLTYINTKLKAVLTTSQYDTYLKNTAAY
jgi:hypothetical protein